MDASETSDSSSSSLRDEAPEFVSINPEHVTYACKVLHERLTPKPAAAEFSFRDVRCAVGQKFCICITWTKPRPADARSPEPAVSDFVQVARTQKLQAFIPPETECRGIAYATSRQLSRAIRKAALKIDDRFKPIQLEELPLLTCSLELLRVFKHLLNDYQPHLHGVLLKAPMGPAHSRYKSDEKGAPQWCVDLFLKEVPWKLDWTFDDTLRELLHQVGHVQGVTYDCEPLKFFRDLGLCGATLKTFTASSYSARWPHLQLGGLDLVQDGSQRFGRGGTNILDAEYEFVPATTLEDVDSEADDEVDGNFLLVGSIRDTCGPFHDADDDADGDFELAKLQVR